MDVVQPEPPSGHSFKFKVFSRPGHCDLCWRPITETGICCRGCGYTCHKRCEFKVIATCVPAQNKEVQSNGVVVNGSTNGVPLRSYSNRIKERPISLDMDLTYITERIIALTYTAAANDVAYRNSVKEMSKMLKVKHIDKYMIMNLSERRHDISRLNKQVMEFGWPARIAPQLEKLCSICKAIDSWLSVDSQHIVVIHSRGDKGRTGVVVSAYMHYTNICTNSDIALDRFSMKRFYDHKLASSTQPSQKRYARYFSGLLSGAIKMNNNPLYLHHIIIHGVPEYDNKGFRPFVKVYQGIKCIFTSGVYHVTDKMKRIVISLDKALALRGDILVKCYHKKVRPPARTAVFRAQFHTCAINDEVLTFSKSELDEACDDDRFLEDCRVEFQFSFSQDQYRALGSINDAMVPVDFSQDSIVRWNSYENFDFTPEDNPNDIDELIDVDETIHTKGPVDGNLYAQVAKKQMNGFIPNQLIQADGSHTASMDSGISSNPGNQGNTSCNTTPNSVNQHANTNGHSNTVETEVEVHNPPEKTKITAISASVPSSGNRAEDQAKLDALINDMMLDIQSMPDVTKPDVIKPGITKYTYSVSNATESSPPPLIESQPFRDYKILGRTVNHTRNEVDSNKPHHARSTSTPFTYGDVTSSPFMPKRQLSLDEQKPQPDRTRSVSPPASDPGLSWLEKQQLKLKDRRDGKGTLDRRYRESRMLAELQENQLNTMHSLPETQITEENIEIFNVPLYNTYSGRSSDPPAKKPPSGLSAPSSPVIPSRSSSKNVTRYNNPQTYTVQVSRTLSRQKSDTSFDRERPFVSVKRAHTIGRNNEPSSDFITSSPISGSTYPYIQHNMYPQNAEKELSPIKIDTNSTYMPQKPVEETVQEPNLMEQIHTSSQESAARLKELESTLQAMGGAKNNRAKQHHRPEPLMTQHVTNGWASETTPSPIRSEEKPIYATPSRSPSVGNDGISRPPKSPSSLRKDRSPSPATVQALKLELSNGPHPPTPTFTTNGQSSPTVYYGQSRRSSLASEHSEVIHGSPMVARDISKYWYKPNISREDAIAVLKDKPAGTFVVRDSNSFPGAFGLALKVSTLPPNVQNKTGDISNELVRHFLIEPTKNGVKLKGCSNEPVFGSLSALVHQHSITPLALPCVLLLPETVEDPLLILDVADSPAQEVQNSPSTLLTQGAACNVLYLGSIDMEALTGPQAVRKAMTILMARRPMPDPVVVHFKVSSQGITLTDNARKKFFRRHYPVLSISHCSMDPDDRRWNTKNAETGLPLNSNRCFGFIAKITPSSTDNQCHLFAELEPEQPASAIVNFVTKVMMADATEQQRAQLL